MKLGLIIFIGVLAAILSAGLIISKLDRSTKDWEKEAAQEIAGLHAAVELSDHYIADRPWDNQQKQEFLDSWKRNQMIFDHARSLLQKWAPWADKSDLKTALANAEYQKKLAEEYLPAAN